MEQPEHDIETLVLQGDYFGVVQQHRRGMPVVGELVKMLNDEDSGVRGGATATLGAIAETDAGAVKPGIPRMTER